MKILLISLLLLQFLYSQSQTFLGFNSIDYKVGDTIIIGEPANCNEYSSYEGFPISSYCSIKYYNSKYKEFYLYPIFHKKDIIYQEFIIKSINIDKGVAKQNFDTKYIFKKDIYYYVCANVKNPNFLLFINRNDAMYKKEIASNIYPKLHDGSQEFESDKAFFYYSKNSGLSSKLLTKEFLDNKKYWNSDYIYKYGNQISYKDLSDLDRMERIDNVSNILYNEINSIDLNNLFYFNTIITSSSYDATNEVYQLDFSKIVFANHSSGPEIKLIDNVFEIKGVKFKIINPEIFNNNQLKIPINNARILDKNLRKYENMVSFYSRINFKFISNNDNWDKSTLNIKITDIYLFIDKNINYGCIAKIE